MPQYPRRIALLLYLGWACNVAAQAEHFACPPLVASTTRQPPYASIPGQQRCEGFYVKNVSQPFLELVSLTRSWPGSWSTDSVGRLTLRASGKLDTRLLIQPMRSNPLYRVDAWLPRGAGVVWESGTMLQVTGLSLRDLGFLALAGPGTDPPSFVPVSAQAAAVGALAYAVLRPSVPVSALAWRAYRLAGEEVPARGWQDLAGTPLFAWERIALPIPLPVDRRGLRVDVRALDSQGLALPLLQFAVVGADDDKP